MTRYLHMNTVLRRFEQLHFMSIQSVPSFTSASNRQAHVIFSCVSTAPSVHIHPYIHDIHTFPRSQNTTNTDTLAREKRLEDHALPLCPEQMDDKRREKMTSLIFAPPLPPPRGKFRVSG